MDVGDILHLLELCLGTTYFQVNGKFFRQKHGAAMGSPVSVIVANLFMEEVEQKSDPVFWARDKGVETVRGRHVCCAQR